MSPNVAVKRYDDIYQDIELACNPLPIKYFTKKDIAVEALVFHSVDEIYRDYSNMKAFFRCLPVFGNAADRQSEIFLQTPFSRRTRKEAINYRFVRFFNKEDDWVKILVIDIDRENAYEDWKDKLPQSNLVIINPTSGHCQYLYLLKEAIVGKDNLKRYWNIRKEMNLLVDGDDNHFHNCRSPYFFPKNRDTKCLKNHVYQKSYAIIIEYSFDIISIDEIELFLTNNSPFTFSSHSTSPIFTYPDMACISSNQPSRTHPDMACTRLEDLPDFEPVPEGSRNITMFENGKAYARRRYDLSLPEEVIINRMFEVYKHFSSGLTDCEIMDTAKGTYERCKKVYDPMKARNSEIQRQRAGKRWINNGESIRKAAKRPGMSPTTLQLNIKKDLIAKNCEGFYEWLQGPAEPREFEPKEIIMEEKNPVIEQPEPREIIIQPQSIEKVIDMKIKEEDDFMKLINQASETINDNVDPMKLPWSQRKKLYLAKSNASDINLFEDIDTTHPFNKPYDSGFGNNSLTT